MRARQRLGGIVLASVIGLAPASVWGATIMGSGITLSCGSWVELRKTQNKAPVEEWSLGYLSGVAMWTPVSPLDGLDPGAVFVWLDNFCQQRPLERFKNALDEFVRQRAAAAAPQQQRPSAAAPQQQHPPAPAPAPVPQTRR